MTTEELRIIMSVLQDTKPSPVHQVEAFEAWEAVVNGLEEAFYKMDPTFDMWRFDDVVGLYDERLTRGSK